jgi:hypothetical protein
MNPIPPRWLLAEVAHEYNWNASDHLLADEILGLMRECPVYGSHEHRMLSTLLLLMADLDVLKSL